MSKTFASDLESVSLSLPAKVAVPEQLMQAVVYQQAEPGEFIDVDLPDKLKRIKYPDYDLKLATVAEVPLIAQNEETAAKHSPYNASPRQHRQVTYSIQVAMYANQRYALSLKKELSAKHLRAFILNKPGKDNKPRYHVRIGHYENRRQAQAALQAFRKQKPNTDAYVVFE